MHHLVTDVHQLIGRWDWEVALFVAEFVAEVSTAVARAVIGAAVPFALVAIDEEIATVGCLVEADVVEDEKLGFRADVAGIGDAGAAEIVDGFASDIARIAGIVFAGDRILDVANHAEGRELREGIDKGGFGLRNQQHVAFVDGLPAANAGAIEPEPVFEDFFVEFADRYGEMLPEPGKVHESQVDGFYASFAAHC